ncbi:MAG: permease [Pseudomonadota bacterium]
MSVTEIVRVAKPKMGHIYALLVLTLLALMLWQPELAFETSIFVAIGVVHVAPMIIPGVLLAAWMTASGAGERVASVFQGRIVQTIVAATVVGAFLPICGVTVLPLMAGLLAAGVPLAAVMAFWLASPITSPAMLSATAAVLGWEFAVGKTLAAIGLGLFGGAVTILFADREWARVALRSNRIVGSLGVSCGGCGSVMGGFNPRIWRSPERRTRFCKDAWSVARLILIVLIPAFAAEHLLNAWLEPTFIASYVGSDSAFAIPLAVLVGGPVYLDGYAAMPLTRSLLEHGMSPGAAMAFLVSGGVVSVWGAMAIFPVLRIKPFLLYLALAVSGSMASGWVFGAAM